jgi:hypothetical protein
MISATTIKNPTGYASLGGYAGGGVVMKQWLLDSEKKN